MNNSSESISMEEYWTDASWIVPVTINGILTTLAMWILFSLVHYGVKTGKWSGTQKRNADKLNAGWVYSSVLACAVICIIRYMTSQISFQQGFGKTEENKMACESINDLLFVEYCLVLFCTYIFLWLRQRTFYTNEMFNINYNKTLRYLSASSIIIILLAGIGVVVVNTLPKNYPASSSGCIYDAETDSLDLWSWVACGVVLVIGQVLLLSLLLYPLAKNLNDEHCLKHLCCFVCTVLKEKEEIQMHSIHSDSPYKLSTVSEGISGHSLVLHSNSICSKSQININTPQRKKQTTKRRKSSVAVKKIMIRTLIFGFVAVFTDLFLISIFAAGVVPNTDPRFRRFAVTSYDLNVFLNLMLVVLSFMTYKNMLTSPCRSEVKQENQSSRVTASSNS